jgi:hypothetical protein
MPAQAGILPFLSLIVNCRGNYDPAQENNRIFLTWCNTAAI